MTLAIITSNLHIVVAVALVAILVVSFVVSLIQATMPAPQPEPVQGHDMVHCHYCYGRVTAKSHEHGCPNRIH